MSAPSRSAAGSRTWVSVFLQCASLMMLDGYDLAVLSFAVSPMASEWGVGRAAFGAVFSIGSIGLMVGSLTLPLAADRWGRRPTLLACLAAFGVMSVATCFAHSPSELIVVRLIGGLALGGAAPNAVALMSEYAPDGRRARFIMLMMLGFTLGQAISGWVAAALLPGLGWRALFVVGGAGPLMLFAVLFRTLPESPAFRPASTRNAGESAKPAGSPARELFRAGRTPRTLFLWAGAFGNLTCLYLLTSWLPTMLERSGLSTAQAARGAAMFSVGGAIATVLCSLAADRLGVLLIFGCYLGGAVAIALLGSVSADPGVQQVLILLIGAGIIGGQAAQNAISGLLYPPSIRATAVGWTLGVGRLGSIAGPALGGFLLGRNVTDPTFFSVSALPELAAAALYLLLFLHLRMDRRSRE